METTRDFKTFERRSGDLPEQAEGDNMDYRYLLHRDGSVLSAVTLDQLKTPEKLYKEVRAPQNPPIIGVERHIHQPRIVSGERIGSGHGAKHTTQAQSRCCDVVAVESSLCSSPCGKCMLVEEHGVRACTCMCSCMAGMFMNGVTSLAHTDGGQADCGDAVQGHRHVRHALHA